MQAVLSLYLNGDVFEGILTTENEGFCLREHALVIKAGKMFVQIACKPKRVRIATDGCNVLFLEEKHTI